MVGALSMMREIWDDCGSLLSQGGQRQKLPQVLHAGDVILLAESMVQLDRRVYDFYD